MEFANFLELTGCYFHRLLKDSGTVKAILMSLYCTYFFSLSQTVE